MLTRSRSDYIWDGQDNGPVILLSSSSALGSRCTGNDPSGLILSPPPSSHCKDLDSAGLQLLVSLFQHLFEHLQMSWLGFVKWDLQTKTANTQSFFQVVITTSQQELVPCMLTIRYVFFSLFFSREKNLPYSSREQTMLITLKRVTPFAAELSLHIA